jgi:hypothetical protein
MSSPDNNSNTDGGADKGKGTAPPAAAPPAAAPPAGDKGAADAKGADAKNADAKGADAKGADAKGDGADAKGAEGDNNKKKEECTTEMPCHGQGTGRVLTFFEKKEKEFEKKARDAVVGSVKNFLKGQQNCAIDIAKNVPKVAKATTAKIQDMNFNIVEPFKKAYLMLKNKLYTIVNRIALGSEWEKIVNDPALKNDILQAKVLKNSRIVKLITEDAEFKKHFEKWSNEYADALVNSLNVAQPAIDKMTGKAQSIIMDTSSKLGNTIGDSLTNTIKTAIAAVPIVGAVVDAAITIGKVGNQILETCEPVISKGAGVVLPIVNAIDYQYEETMCKGKKLLKPIKSAVERVEKKMAASPAAGGGKLHHTRKHLNYKIKKATRRVQHLLKNFKPAATAAAANTTLKFHRKKNHAIYTKRHY